MLINIDGWYGAGKSIVWSLLDNHPELFVCPVHEYSYHGLLSCSNNDDWLKKKYSTKLRRILALSEYYKLEKIMYDGFTSISLSSSVSIDVSYDTDFYTFDRVFFKSLQCLDSWTLENILTTLYKSLSISHKANMKHGKASYPDNVDKFVFLGHPESYIRYSNIPNLFPSMKTIIVRRSVEGILATRKSRQVRHRDLARSMFNVSFNKSLRTSQIEKILHFYDACQTLEYKHPNHFLIVDFDDLIHNLDAAVKQISEFIEIPVYPSLYSPSRDGIPLEKSSLSLLNKQNDDPNTLLTSRQRLQIKLHEQLYRIHKSPYNPLSLFAIFQSLLSFLRNKLYNIYNYR